MANKFIGYNLGLFEPQFECSVSKVLHYFYSLCHSQWGAGWVQLQLNITMGVLLWKEESFPFPGSLT